MGTYEALYEQAMGLVERYAEIKSPTGNKEEESLINHMAFFSEFKQRHERINKLNEEANRKLDNVTTPKEGKSVIAAFEESLKKLDKIKAKDDARYVKFASKLNVSFDEDVQTIKTVRQAIDPISKKKMTDPVKNSICGHTYEKSSVMQLMKMTPKTRCPMVGCNFFLSKANLVPDLEMKRYILTTEDDAINSPNVSGICLDDTV